MSLDELGIDGKYLLAQLLSLADHRRASNQEIIAKLRLCLEIGFVQLDGLSHFFNGFVEQAQILIRTCKAPMRLCRIGVQLGRRAKLHQCVVEFSFLEIFLTFCQERGGRMAACSNKDAQANE